jgi:type I restriction enzyme S subunit
MSCYPIQRLKWAARLQYGDALGADVRRNADVPVLGSNGEVGKHDIANTRGPVVVVGRKGSFGKVAYSLRPCFCIDTAYFIDERHTIADLRWLYWALQTLNLDAVSLDTGVPGLSRDAAHNAAVPTPNRDEQRAIADFLDRETGKIDSLIEKKQILVRKLHGQKADLVSFFVLHGIHSCERAPSGSAWLGSIPMHWKRTRLKYATSLIVDCPHETPVYSPDGAFPVVRTADITLGALELRSAYRLSEDDYLHRVRRAKVLPQDIVYGREGERWGFAALVPAHPPLCLGQRMMQFRPAPHFDPPFLMWHLNARCVYEQGVVDTVGATSPHVNVETIRNYQLVEPPLDEQIVIARHIDSEVSKIDSLIATVENGIALVNEYRRALISAAVTGQIDVHNSRQQEAAALCQ